jgi:hypothetical protein
VAAEEHVPQATWKQPSTWSPTRDARDRVAAASTVPTYSWPIVKPGSICHAAVEDVEVRAADAGGLDADDRVVGARSSGSGFSSTRTSYGAWKVTALIARIWMHAVRRQSHRKDARSSGESSVRARNAGPPLHVSEGRAVVHSFACNVRNSLHDSVVAPQAPKTASDFSKSDGGHYREASAH